MPVEQLIRELTWGKCGEEPRALQGWPRQAFVSGIRRAVPPPPRSHFWSQCARATTPPGGLCRRCSLTLCGPTAESSSAGALLPFCVPSPGSSVFCCRGGTGGAAWAPWPGGNRPPRHSRGTAGAAGGGPGWSSVLSGGPCCLCAWVGGLRKRGRAVAPLGVPCAAAQLFALALHRSSCSSERCLPWQRRDQQGRSSLALLIRTVRIECTRAWKNQPHGLVPLSWWPSPCGSRVLGERHERCRERSGTASVCPLRAPLLTWGRGTRTKAF